MTCIRRSVLGLLPLGLVFATAAMATADVAAQGPVYRERWGYLHLENLRAKVFDELASRSAEDVAKVAELLVGNDRGVPFRPVAAALAHLRGVEADDAFVFRATVGMYLLPEVVDAESTVETCRSANFSLFLPFSLTAPGAVTFELRVRNAEGKEVWAKALDKAIELSDLRMAQITASAPAEKLPDGRYEVELRTLFDGVGPRPKDPILRWQFHARRGYQARAEKVLAITVTDRMDYAPYARAHLDGIAGHVSRAFSGEAFAVRSNALRELENLEACIANLEAKRSPLHGIEGAIATALPAGNIIQPCTIRAVADDKPHPLVVFVTGAPAYDTGSRRPTAPAMRESSWLSREMGDFGLAEKWHVAYCDSPGGGRPFARALLATLQALPKALSTGGQKPLLVCDREAAGVVGLQLGKFRPHIGGVVFVGGGAIPANTVKQLQGLPVRMVKLAGYPGSRAIGRMLTFVEALGKEGGAAPDIGLLHDRDEPWLFGVSRSRDELRKFATQVFGER